MAGLNKILELFFCQLKNSFSVTIFIAPFHNVPILLTRNGNYLSVIVHYIFSISVIDYNSPVFSYSKIGKYFVSISAVPNKYLFSFLIVYMSVFYYATSFRGIAGGCPTRP